MKHRTIFISTLVLFVLCVVWSAPCLLLTPYEKGYSITSFVEDSDLIVYGTVMEKDFVPREPYERCTTNITIDVKEVIIRSATNRIIFGGICLLSRPHILLGIF